jgi:hypothetical protein
VKSLTPAQSLVLLILFGLAISGWLYGIHWKRVASGDLFSSDEKLMIRLQDQISTLSETNANLNEQLKAYADEEVAPKEGEPVTVPALEVPQNAPALPAPPQKIESH